MLRTRLAALAVIAVSVAGVFAGCGGSNADTASSNLSKQAEQFKVVRRVVAINGITDKPLIEVVGRCSIERTNLGLELICKEGPNAYKKYFVGISDNVTYTVTQLAPVDVSEYRTKVIFRPESLVPDFDLATSANTP